MLVRYIASPGDEVIISISTENRAGGYRPYDDGEIVKIVEFSTIHYGRVNNGYSNYRVDSRS